MFEYTFTNVIEVLTPFEVDFDQVKTEVTQTNEYTRNLFKYPNGLILDTYQYRDKVVIKSNRKLEEKDGAVSVVL
ncbi:MULTISPECIES: hypothetical protein [Clostridium]|jgi:hypothetical protein|uniref:Uncharacterized protein n=2 Tax=Clostridium intestinale TaxID=36845 RepID=A0A7D7A2C9_9CLOT|nr:MULTISPECIES: hypothetical protein [Clostridium]QLY78640.1 hypothetical protein HZF06_16325 [Clostridium intestinale]WRY53732.1 hypothetical protein P8F83_11075 [Clostridium intestinale]SHI07097.1 hypothetical protein SAMN02745941_01858 [Clostridium intestinale DSM 6191]